MKHLKKYYLRIYKNEMRCNSLDQVVWKPLKGVDIFWEGFISFKTGEIPFRKGAYYLKEILYPLERLWLPVIRLLRINQMLDIPMNERQATT